jgi:hypothetical protein
MKRYYDLTHEELIALDEKAMEQLVDLEVAFAGIMPVACPEVPSLEKEGIVRSETAYKVGFMYFSKEEDALAVSRLTQYEVKYDYNTGYDYKWLEPEINQTITKEQFYKQTDVVMIKDILQKNKAKRETFERQKNLYDKFLSETGKIREQVYSAWREALKFEQELTDARNLLVKYRDLAGGDETVAITFLRNTYKSREDILGKVNLGG